MFATVLAECFLCLHIAFVIYTTIDINLSEKKYKIYVYQYIEHIKESVFLPLPIQEMVASFAIIFHIQNTLFSYEIKVIIILYK